jgi:hypothetical protein
MAGRPRDDSERQRPTNSHSSAVRPRAGTPRIVGSRPPNLTRNLTHAPGERDSPGWRSHPRLPLLTTRLTLAPFARTAPNLGFCEITPPALPPRALLRFLHFVLASGAFDGKARSLPPETYPLGPPRMRLLSEHQSSSNARSAQRPGSHGPSLRGSREASERPRVHPVARRRTARAGWPR